MTHLWHACWTDEQQNGDARIQKCFWIANHGILERMKRNNIKWKCPRLVFAYWIASLSNAYVFAFTAIVCVPFLCIFRNLLRVIMVIVVLLPKANQISKYPHFLFYNPTSYALTKNELNNEMVLHLLYRFPPFMRFFLWSNRSIP